MTNSQITIQQAVCNCQQRLIENSDSPQLEVEVLLAHVLQSNRTYLRTWPEKLLTTQQLAQLEGFIERRNNGEPIAYITGEREFWGMSLHVSPDTLIPRPETETLVELALERIPRDAEWQIADLGTGSGAIALAIARERPRCLVLATDISPAALAMARHNATRLGLDNLRFADGAWCTALGNERLEMILSNPPYVAPGDPHLQQGDLRFEPPAALASADNGLADIRQICQTAHQHLREPGWLLLEHGYDQGAAVPALLREAGYRDILTVQDFAGQERVSLGAWRP